MYKRKRIGGETWFKANKDPIPFSQKERKERFKRELQNDGGYRPNLKVRSVKTKKGWDVYTDWPW